MPAAARARSKSRGASARTTTKTTTKRATASKSATKKTPARGRSRKRAPVPESEDDEDEEEDEEDEDEEEDEEEEEELEEEAVLKVAKVVVATEPTSTLYGTTLACRIIYAQLFVLGVFAMVLPDVLLEVLYGPAAVSKGSIASTASHRWLGVVLVQLSLMVIAAVQGTYADQKKALQYLMFFPLMMLGMTVGHVDLLSQDSLTTITSLALINEGLMIWACYYSESP